MATVRLTGGSALRARLTNVASVPQDFAAAWAAETVDKIQASKPHSVRPASSKFTTKVSRLRAGVYGAFWWVFVDRGSKRHEITGGGAKNPPDTLMFTVGSRTIFAKKVTHPRTGRRPFISRAAQGAFHGGADFIIQSWNGRRRRGHQRFL